MTLFGHSFYKGKATMQILASIKDHDGPESEPYKRVMRECGTGLPMPDDTAPFRKLGPVAWVSFAIIFAFPAGMILGAASKSCDCGAAVSGGR